MSYSLSQSLCLFQGDYHHHDYDDDDHFDDHEDYDHVDDDNAPHRHLLGHRHLHSPFQSLCLFQGDYHDDDDDDDDSSTNSVTSE